MSLMRYGMVLVSALVLAVQGCGSGSTEKSAQDKGQAKQSVFDLHAQLAQARDEVQREQERNADLRAQVQSLTEKINQSRAESKGAGAAPGRQEAASAPDASRIQLIGEKALAEYKAGQLSRRLDELSKNLDRKEKELESIRQTAQTKENEVAVLRQQIDKLQAAEQSRSAALNTRLDQITKQLEERSAAAAKFKQELDEKSELLNALKSAVADANKLRSAADNESSRLQTELAEGKRQLDAARQQATQWYQEAERRGQEGDQKAQEADRWRQEAERYRSMAEASSKDLQELKAHAGELAGRLQAMEGEAESQEEQDQSSIDRLLRGPKAQEASEPQSNLY